MKKWKKKKRERKKEYILGNLKHEMAFSKIKKKKKESIKNEILYFTVKLSSEDV